MYAFWLGVPGSLKRSSISWAFPESVNVWGGQLAAIFEAQGSWLSVELDDLLENANSALTGNRSACRDPQCLPTRIVQDIQSAK